MIEMKDPLVSHMTKEQIGKSRYNKGYYLITSYYVRNGDISQEIEFSIWPFGIRSYYGYWHQPGE
jgi:hypothetical protein